MKELRDLKDLTIHDVKPISDRRDSTSQSENNYFTEMRSGSEAGSYLRLIYFVYHSTLGLRVIKKRRRGSNEAMCAGNGAIRPAAIKRMLVH